MPKQYPEEFRRDVTAVARKHAAPLSQVAHDFGVSEGYLCRWMRQVDVEEGVRESLTLVE
jgi:transposase-like protein